jgi:hypothetical protein
MTGANRELIDLDIELACKLVRHGNAPTEVPVDALPSYAAFFRYRFTRP